MAYHILLFSKLIEVFLKKGLQFRKRCGIITEPSDETANRIVGVDYNEGPPVPIPNTEVKLVCAENTRLATARDDRLAPTLRRITEMWFFFIFLKQHAAHFIKKCAAIIFALKLSEGLYQGEYISLQALLAISFA